MEKSHIESVLRLVFWSRLSSIGLAMMLVIPLSAREPKEYDSDVNYDESRLPSYDLPDPLIMSNGRKVTSPDEWFNIRRPEILGLFSNLVYGRIPEPAEPLAVKYIPVSVDRNFMDGKATRKEISIRLSNSRGEKEIFFVLFVPNGLDAPAPVVLKHSFNNTRKPDFNASSDQPGRLQNGWPVGKFFDQGIGFAAVYHEDLVKHNEVGFLDSIHRLFYPEGQSFPKAHEWGVIAACSWSASVAMDYLETDKDVDASRVAVMGHSKMGKTALWTAARDDRFALAVSAQSGCAGAALWRRKSGETLKKMVTRFPYWLCRNAWKFVEQEDDLPVDQHMLLACIAPRPVYVHSAVDDTWADPRGEYLSAWHASEVYRFLGKTGLESEAQPEPGQPILDSDVGYHTREGGHSINDYDWDQFATFIGHHFNVN